MLRRLRIISLIISASLFITGGAYAQFNSIEGSVIGANGKPVAGAEVRVERNGGKAQVTRTDADGAYAFKKLADGTYKVSMSANKLAASVNNVRTDSQHVVRVRFDLRPNEVKAADASKKHKHMVWVPSRTGSQVSGRWVDPDDTAAMMTGADRVDNASPLSLQRLSGTQPNRVQIAGPN